MNIGTPLRYVTPGVRGKVWTFKDSQDNCGDFGVKGTSLGKNSVLPKISRWSRFGENYSRAVKRPHGCKQLDYNSHFESTRLASKENISKLKRPSLKDNFEIIKHIEHSHLARKDTKMKGKLSGSSQSAQQKAYLRMVFSRSPHDHSTSNDNNFDEDYISLDDELFSRYLKEGSEIQHSSFVPTNVRSAEIGTPTELRSGVKSGKCRLRRKYADLHLGVTASDNNLVKYGR